mmetsp:Transcript_13655/g.17176  ORF Transcript_13655/g.17176 Transcript_13655/m.17176 type:complete len:219 (+) Transcript_13655:765-1421(+)
MSDNVAEHDNGELVNIKRIIYIGFDMWRGKKSVKQAIVSMGVLANKAKTKKERLNIGFQVRFGELDNEVASKDEQNMGICIGVGTNEATKTGKQDVLIKYGVRSGVGTVEAKNMQETNSGVRSGVAAYKKEENRVGSGAWCKVRFSLFHKFFFGETEVFSYQDASFYGAIKVFSRQGASFWDAFYLFRKGFFVHDLGRVIFPFVFEGFLWDPGGGIDQ